MTRRKVLKFIVLLLTLSIMLSVFSACTDKSSINKNVDRPTQNGFTINYSDMQLSQQESELIGFWHSMPNVVAGYAERYLFYKDRVYKCLPSLAGNITETITKSGKWGIKDNKLYLLEDNKSENKVIEIGAIENASENPAYKFKVKIGDQYYWKFSDNPDFQDEINIKSTNNPLPSSSVTSNVPKPINEDDFSITDGKNVISLYMTFKDLKLNKTELKVDNNYVGETKSNGFVYKYYMHQYDEFDLYVSNVNYNFKSKNFDDRYISQITLKKKSDFKTPRGITIGSTLKEVDEAYGQVTIKKEDGKDIVEYQLNDMDLKFFIDSNQKVSSIMIYIIVK